MKTLVVICEGRTEVDIVQQVFSPRFDQKLVRLQPIVLQTGSNPQGGAAKGGDLKFDRLRGEVKTRLKHLKHGDLLTTMIDWYGLPRDYPGMQLGQPSPSITQVTVAVHQAFASDPRFLPYFCLHETEALCFASPEGRALLEVFPRQAKQVQALWREVEHLGPEEINGGAETAPSKRLKDALQGYDKRLHGVDILERTPFDEVLARCPHFGAWWARLQAWAGR